MLHPEELILNKKETNDLIDVTHLLDRMIQVFPDIQKPSLAKRKETAENITINNHYDIDINIERMSGSKKDVEKVSDVLLRNVRKSGK